MGNSCGALHKYTEYAYEEPLYQGGFIWDYIDQSITKKDRYGKGFQAYGGDFKEHPTDYYFSGNGIVYGDTRAASPKMQEVKFCYQFIRILVEEEKIRVENRNLFTNTDAYRCIVSLKRDGKEIEQKEITISVPPLQSKEFEVPVEKKTYPGEYVITVSFVLKEDTKWAESGYEIAFGQGIYRVAGERKLINEPLTVVRWAEIVDSKGRGIRFETEDYMEVSALPFDPHELENAKHPYELPAVHSTVVRIAQQQMGVAGDDGWGARVHSEYLLDVKQKKEFKFYFKGI